MKKRDLLMIGLVMALSLPLNVWAATTLGESLSVDDGGDPDITLDAGDAYVEGTLEVDGLSYFDNHVRLSEASGPNLNLFNPTTTPPDLTSLGVNGFSGYDDDGNITDYAAITGLVNDDTDGDESGIIAFTIMDDGVFQTKAVLSGGGFSLWEDALTSTPGYTLNVNRDSSSTYSLATDEGDIGFSGEFYEDFFFLDYDSGSVYIGDWDEVESGYYFLLDDQSEEIGFYADGTRVLFADLNEVAINDDQGGTDFRVKTDDRASAVYVETDSSNPSLSLNIPFAMQSSGSTIFVADGDEDDTLEHGNRSFIRVAAENGLAMGGTPNIADGYVDGQVLVVMGTDSDDVIRFQDQSNLPGSGLRLNNNNDRVLGEYGSMMLMWDDEEGVWFEVPNYFEGF